ncbi:MFS transporter [Tabrizicola sp. J26]|uniref:MFS transporter n=1 Tax=Alitabrizicola rongguiensis TaxID=2909234 RepID=UPI001F3E3C13|nr:MFS transporter [Tabrizicola rongguiensis]MCF1707701.1 MFS transporter [Tabrizicola rongguiensis]
MRVGLICLVLAYVLSQFYRAFLAVLTPSLVADLHMTAEQLALASNLWFVAFALMQLPVGEALDRVGPRLTVGTLLFFVAAGAALFASANGPGAIMAGMALIGIGCAPALMTAYFVYARNYPTAVFGTFAGIVAGLGSLGNVASALPFAWAVEAFGWRMSVWGLAALSLAISIATAALMRDLPRVEGGHSGSLLDLLRDRRLWPLFAMMAVCYYPAAALRDLWVGPYARDVFGYGDDRIGQLTLVMAVTMGIGNFVYGLLDRYKPQRRAIILWGNLLCAAGILALWVWPDTGPVPAIALLGVVGLFGTSFPLVMAYGKGDLPKAMLGRGVTLLNFFGIGATGIAQAATGQIYEASSGSPAPDRFALVFLFFGLTLLAGLAAFALGRRKAR